MGSCVDVAIIGAGPSGTVAAALLNKLGHEVTIIEQTHFPRFSIGESLLPQCMVFLEEAGLLQAVNAAGFQSKNGAAFWRSAEVSEFDFREKFTSGPGVTFQVKRAEFDHLLAKRVCERGIAIRFGESIQGFRYDAQGDPCLEIRTATGEPDSLTSKFVLDASGFGRVLPRLLDLEAPSAMPPRVSVFSHVQDNISDAGYDRNKILIAVHPDLSDVWYWLIPFSDGRCSVGAVGPESFFDQRLSEQQLLKNAIRECPELDHLLANSDFDSPCRKISGYSCNVSSLYGKGYALLGNAAEFLDPVFSSGLTIAMKSASLAAPLVSEQLKGGEVNWQTSYEDTLRYGINTFRVFVESWYRGDFQDVIFSKNQTAEVRTMISSILAGYAWDNKNPYVNKAGRRLRTLVELCRHQ